MNDKPKAPLEGEPIEALILLKEAATRIHPKLSYSHLRLLARTGRLAARQVGREWLTSERAVREYLQDVEKRKRGPRKHSGA